jgi:formylglycine-generating enzyme required for sulfatase activity
MQHLLFIGLLLIVSLITFDRITGLTMQAHTNNASQQVLSEPQPAAQDAQIRQQAEAAVALLKQGQDKNFWPLLRHSPDPSLRTYLIHNLGRIGVNPALLIRRLEAEKDVSIRRALILSLGEFTEEQLPASLRSPLVPKLLRWYRDDPDAGIHAAIDWLLRYGKQGDAPRKLDWGQSQALIAIDRQLTGRPAGKRDWYVTKDGQTLAIIRGPVEFVMGSPVTEPGRTADEIQHRVRIPRSFAVASKEITVAQFQRFLAANPNLEQRYPDPGKDPRRVKCSVQSPSAEADCPQIFMTWYEAAQYCNWLSQQEGIPASEWVYPANLAEIKTGMTLPKDYLHRTGYRMLTEAEWEFASRAGATTSRYFGLAEEFLEEYAVYSKNPPKKKGDPNDPRDPQHTWRVGQRKPNDLGLFDLYGNVWEWGHARRLEFSMSNSEDVEDHILTVNDQQYRLRRGGSFTYEASYQRSAHRGRPDGYVPNERRDSVGFRIGRTYR